jgi:hypothetical protein
LKPKFHRGIGDYDPDAVMPHRWDWSSMYYMLETFLIISKSAVKSLWCTFVCDKCFWSVGFSTYCCMVVDYLFLVYSMESSISGYIASTCQVPVQKWSSQLKRVLHTFGCGYWYGVMVECWLARENWRNLERNFIRSHFV